MKYWLWFLGLCLSLLLAAPAMASSDTEELKRMLEELKKEVQELKKENAELRAQVEQIKTSPAAVKAKHSFASKGAYGSTPSGIDFYGYFKIDAVWQDSKAYGDNYVLFVLPGTDANKGDNNFTLNYRHSRFGFDFSKPTDKFRVFGKIEMDFYTRVDEVNGGSYAWNDVHSPVRARRVFAGVEWGTWQLLAGLEWQTISQLYPHLSNFPAGSFMGNMGFRMTQVRLTKIHKLNDDSRLKIQVAAEQPYSFPTSTIGPYDNDPANDAGFPGIEARVAYEGKLNGKPMLLALWGHYSQEEYDTGVGEIDADSYSLGLEYKIPVPLGVKAFILGELWMGRNVDGYYTAGVNQGTRFEYTNGSFSTSGADLGNVVAIDEIDAVGGWIELEVFFTPKLVTHFGYGIDNPDNDDLAGVKGARLQQQMYYANVLYRLTKEFALGAEYMYVETDYHESDGGDGKLNRISGSLYYFF